MWFGVECPKKVAEKKAAAEKRAIEKKCAADKKVAERMATAIILITAEEDLGLTSIIIKLLNCLASNLYWLN